MRSAAADFRSVTLRFFRAEGRAGSIGFSLNLLNNPNDLEPLQPLTWFVHALNNFASAQHQPRMKASKYVNVLSGQKRC
jgi:hypothetical protein